MKNSSKKTGLKGIKKDFPIFTANPKLVYLDTAATSFKPACVISAVNDYYSKYSANVHRGLYDLSEKASAAYEGARTTVKNFVNAKSEKEIIFTRGTTEALNIVAKGWGEQFLKSGDQIVLSILEHHSNIIPWQMIAKKKNCYIKFVDIDKNGMLKMDELNELLSRKTKIVAISHVSNALGTINPIKKIIQKAHAVSAKVVIDAAQSVPHMPVDVQHLDCDFLAFSGHKMCGPTGIGVLYGKEDILNKMEPFFGGGDMIKEVTTEKSNWNDLPWKFEAGTPPIAEAIGLGAAVKYLQSIGMEAIREHEKSLLKFALERLKKIPEVQLFGPCDSEIQGGVISFTIKGAHPHDIAAVLNEENIAVRAGHHCCMPLMQKLCVPATTRASFYIYTTEEDIERLCEGISKVIKIFGK